MSFILVKCIRKPQEPCGSSLCHGSQFIPADIVIGHKLQILPHGFLPRRRCGIAAVGGQDRVLCAELPYGFKVTLCIADPLTVFQRLHVLALSDYSEQTDFVSKLVGCFAEEQTDEQLIAAVNTAFGTTLNAEDFTKVMTAIRAKAINTSGFTDPDTKNAHDLVEWAKQAYGFCGRIETRCPSSVCFSLISAP